MLRPVSPISCVLLALCFSGPAWASCGATFCTISNDWRAQGVWNEPGFQADLRYEFIDQDRLRAGTHRVAVGEIPRDHDEVRTINRNVLLGLDYNFANGMGLNVQIPWVSRTHDHIQNGDDGPTAEHWDIAEFGDARVSLRLPLGRDSGFSANLGVKLPTGKTNVRNDEGELAERSLQPGSGSTDTILGFSYHARPNHETPFTWFAQTSWQHAVTTHDQFKPGDRYTFDLGGRYAFTEQFSAILQANVQFRQHDRGANAEPEDTGGTFLYVSPGVSYALGRDTQVYAFVQVPAYRDVKGVQLTTSTSVSVGISRRF